MSVVLEASSSPLTDRQAAVFDMVRKYHRLTGRGCPAIVIAERLDIHHEAVRGHFAALYRKGWLATPGSPATPRQSYLSRRR